MPAADASPGRSTAIIVGASLTGLLAAKVLAPHFAEVRVLERDPEPIGPEARRGIPQGHHSHVLLVRGLGVLERIFPGIAGDLEARGAVPFDYAADGRLRLGGRYLPRFRSGVRTFSCTRALLEWRVREALRGEARVSLEYGVSVGGLKYLPGAGRVAGVMVQEAAGRPGANGFQPADLVVDASGRASRLPAWLADAGLPAPRESVVDPRVGYASRLYALPEGFDPGWKVVGQAANFPSEMAGGAMLRVEGGRLLATLVGVSGNFPPADEEGFEAFARGLPDPLIHRTLADLRPLGPVKAYRHTANRIRHYEEMRDFPGGLAVLGDAACALNPIYAQGLSLSAMGAELLGRIPWSRIGFTAAAARKFQAALARGNRMAWTMAVSEDIRWPETQGSRPRPWNHLMYAYMRRVIAAMADDEEVTRRFLRVMHLVSHPAALFHPEVLVAVLRGGRRRGPGLDAGGVSNHDGSEPIPAGAPAERRA